MKVRHKLAVGYLAIMALIGVFGYFAIRQSKKSQEKAIIEAALALSTQVIEEIDTHLFEELLQFQIYTQTGVLQDAVAQSNRRFDALDDVEAYLDETDKNWTSTSDETVTPFMQNLIENNLSKEIRREMKMIATQRGNKAIAELFITNKYGANVGQSAKTTDYRQDDEAWWQEAKRNGHYIGNIEYDYSANVYALSMAIAITDANDEFAGVLKAVVNISDLIHLIDKVKEHHTNVNGRNDVFKLIDSTNRLIYSTSPHEVLEKVPDIFDAKNSRIAVQIDPTRGQFLCVRSTVPDQTNLSGLNWTFIVEMTESEVFAPVRRQRNNLIMFAAAVGILSILMGWGISRSIAKPIARLSEGMKIVASGKLDHKVAIDSKDEIGDLSQTFEHMTGQLQKTMVSNTALEQEVAERKRSEAALAASEERLNLIFDQAADGILIADIEQKKFCDCNSMICEMLGYIPEEILKLGLSDIHPEKDLLYVQEQFKKQASGKKPMAKELPIKRKDGSVFYADVNSVSMTLEGKKCLVGFFRDVTDRRRAQKKLNLYASEMEKANEEVKQFAYIVSHDLRAPLVNLKGFSSELRASRDSLEKALEAALPHLSDEERNTVNIALQEDMPEALNFIDSSTSRMDNLISALLTLSRMGRRELKFEDVATNEILELVLKGIGHQIEETNTHVCVGALPHVYADRTALEQIFGNILSNAVAYLEPDRPGKIEITAEQNDEETTIYIHDNGRGIAEEDIPKVFAPFRRAGKQNVKGEGMGMAFVQTLVRRHGGHIRCESELDVGTTFIFTLRNQEKSCEHDVHITKS